MTATTKVGEDEARRIWVVEPRQELPLGETIWFDIAPGLVSSEGPETGTEKRTLVSFETYPPFEFLGLRCTPKGERRPGIFRSPSCAHRKAKASGDRCVPLNPIGLIFSAPVKNTQVRDHVTFSPPAWMEGATTTIPGKTSTILPAWTIRTARDAITTSGCRNPCRRPGNIPVGFDVARLQDEFGRHLAEPVDFSFVTSHREPRLVLNHYVAVLEKGVDSDVPLYVTNLNKVTVAYDKLGRSQARAGLTETMAIKGPEDIAYAMPMGVRKLLGESSGVLYGYLHPDPVPARLVSRPGGSGRGHALPGCISSWGTSIPWPG